MIDQGWLAPIERGDVGLDEVAAAEIAAIGGAFDRVAVICEEASPAGAEAGPRHAAAREEFKKAARAAHRYNFAREEWSSVYTPISPYCRHIRRLSATIQRIDDLARFPHTARGQS